MKHIPRKRFGQHFLSDQGIIDGIEVPSLDGAMQNAAWDLVRSRTALWRKKGEDNANAGVPR